MQRCALASHMERSAKYANKAKAQHYFRYFSYFENLVGVVAKLDSFTQVTSCEYFKLICREMVSNVPSVLGLSHFWSCPK